LLDVLDFHLYPENKQDITLQIHRIFYDETYNYPGANGCKVINGGWDNSITKEYIFKRSNDWLNKYMGENHGVTMGMSEMGSLYDKDPNVMAVCYASLLGTFAENNVEIFTPWDWYIGQWEVLHLFTHYAGTTSVQSASSLNEKVSAYSSLNVNKDMLSVVLVNRDVANSQTAGITLENITSLTGNASYYQLSNLPATETFQSASNNALKTGNVAVNNRLISLTLPKLSVTVVQISIKSLLSGVREIARQDIHLYPNPAKNRLMVTPKFESSTTLNFINMTGQTVKTLPLTAKTIDVSSLEKGIYIVQIRNKTVNYNQKLIIE
jgi:hypothetical protein